MLASSPPASSQGPRPRVQDDPALSFSPLAAPTHPLVGFDRSKSFAALQLIKAGHLSKASSRLTSLGSLPRSTSTAEALQQLHPTSVMDMPSPPAVSHVLIIDDEHLRQALDKCANGSGPGASGWTGDLLLPLSRDPVIMPAIKAMVDDLVHARLGPDVSDLLRLSLLSALKKKPGSPTPRPVANGELFTKLAATYLLFHIGLDTLCACFPEIQLAWQKGGVERAIHLIQSWIDAPSAPSLLISADATNAFNTRERAHILVALYAKEELSPLFVFSFWLYGKASLLLFRLADGSFSRIVSAQGVRQGCVLGSFLFSLSMQPLYRFATDAAPVVSTAIIDDFHIFGDAFSALAAYDAYVAITTETDSGISLHPTKKWAMWIDSSPPPTEVVDACAERGLKLVDSDCVELLGSFVGSSPQRIAAALVDEMLDGTQRLCAGILDLASSFGSVQSASLLLRLCANAKPTFLCRTLPPRVTAQYARHHDNLVFGTFLSLFRLPISVSRAATFYISLPLRLSGMGLRPCFRTRFACYWGSALSALRHVFLQSPPDPPTPVPSSPVSPASNASTVSIPASLLPSSPSSPVAFLLGDSLSTTQSCSALESDPAPHVSPSQLSWKRSAGRPPLRRLSPVPGSRDPAGADAELSLSCDGASMVPLPPSSSQAAMGDPCTPLTRPGSSLATIPDSVMVSPVLSSSLDSASGPQHTPDELIGYLLADHGWCPSILTNLRSIFDHLTSLGGVEPKVDSPVFFEPTFDASVLRVLKLKSSTPRGVQRLLTALVENFLDDSFRAGASPTTIARLLSTRAKCAAAWLMAIPSEPLLVLSAGACTAAVRHRLGLPPLDIMPSHCSCGARIVEPFIHAHTCPKTRRVSVNKRHELIELVLRVCCAEAACLVIVEDHSRRHEWPDLQIFFLPDIVSLPTGHILSDVSVACPAAPSHVSNAQRRSGKVADTRADCKIARYRRMALQLGADSVPFTIETYGALSKCASQLVKHIVNAYGELPNAPLSTDSFRMLVQQRLSVALQKGNFIVETQGIQLARSARAAHTHAHAHHSRSTMLSANPPLEVPVTHIPAKAVASSPVASRAVLDAGSVVDPARLLSASLSSSAPSSPPVAELCAGPWDCAWSLRSTAASSLSQGAAIFGPCS